MTTPTPTTTTPEAPRRSRAAVAALYLAIGALIAAALLGAFFIIVGDQSNVAGRAWLTLFLVALFAGAVLLDTNVSNGPNRWYLIVSTLVNIVIVAIGLLKLWNGWLQPEDTASAWVWTVQMWRLFGIIVLLRLALLFMQFYGLAFVTRARTALGKILAIVTIALVWMTALVLAIPAAFPEFAWPEWWWRIAGATALIAVVTTVVPLLLRAFEPKPPKPAVPQVYAAPAQGYYGQPGQVQGYPAQGAPYPGQPQPFAPQQGQPGVPPVPGVPLAPQVPQQQLPQQPVQPQQGEQSPEVPGVPRPPQ